MSSRRSRPRPSGWEVSAVDRISGLPESIITEILNLLPTKDAAATSVLSKSWRFRWKDVTTFDIEVPPLSRLWMELFDDFESFRRFCLRWNVVPTAISAIPETVRVLDLASEHKSNVVNIEIPAGIYTCKTLEVMKLDGEFLKVKLPDVVCLPRLAELELNWVLYQSNQTISELVRSCPVLQSLALKMRMPAKDRTLTLSSLTLKRLHLSCMVSFQEKRKYDNKKLIILKIDAPTLEYLELHDSVSDDISVHGLGLSSLKEVELNVFGLRPNSVVGLLESFHGVKFLKLLHFFVIRISRATRKFSASFDRLTKLDVDFSTCPWNSNWLVDFIHQCVNLKILTINITSRSHIQSPPVVILPRCLSSSLHTLEATFVLPSESEFDLKMMEFILKHGSVLRRVNLCFEFHCHRCDINEAEACQKMDVIVERVLEMPKSSPNCKFFTKTVLCGYDHDDRRQVYLNRC